MAATQAVSGNRIRQARLSVGLTQAALARAVNTGERNIVRWENDQNAPRLKHLAAIAQATGKDIAFFIEAAEGDDDEEVDPLLRIRRIRAELVLHGRDDLAEDLLRLARGWV
jgi:transcriptional regulator with XRE-family HTH domain